MQDHHWPKTDRTSLNLLTRDGAVAVTFEAKLTPDQYLRLYASVHEAETKAQLERHLTTVADEWGIAAVIEDSSSA